MIKGFNKVNVYLNGIGIVKRTIEVEDGKIKKISQEDHPDYLTLSEDKIVIPGFIDEHIHGANNSDAMYPELKHIENIAKTVASEGVTSFCATTMTQSVEAIDAALKNIKEYIESNNPEGAEVIGIHLEGPFISKNFKGAQGEQWILDCDVDKFKHFEEVSGNNIKIITMAYENNGKDLVKYLCEKGIVASLGHTAATYEEAIDGFKNGMKCTTHTYNAMQAFKNREPGTVGAALVSDSVRCELIGDLFHVSPTAIKILLKCKGLDKVIAITDGMEAKHLEDGEYALGGQPVYVKDGFARLADGTIAGSTLKMNVAMANFTKVIGLSFTQAVDLATVNPALNLGIYDHKGSIEKGKDADFAVVDKNFNVYLTVRGGNVVYEK